MKQIALLFFVFTSIGCTPEKNINVDEFQHQELSSFVAEECVVKEEWLNLEYDHNVDYKNPNIPTDFFLLVYSNSPNFCEYKESQGKLDEVPFQCTSPNQFSWVIHGLWGESRKAYITGEKEKHPRFCQGNLEPLSLEILKPYLCMSPGTSLLQGEWEKHGACDFDTAQLYFEKAKELYKSFGVPSASLTAKNAVKWMKNNHPELKEKWLHQTKHEFGVCFTTDFEIMSCPRKNN